MRLSKSKNRMNVLHFHLFPTDTCSYYSREPSGASGRKKGRGLQSPREPHPFSAIKGVSVDFTSARKFSRLPSRWVIVRRCMGVLGLGNRTRNISRSRASRREILRGLDGSNLLVKAETPRQWRALSLVNPRRARNLDGLRALRPRFYSATETRIHEVYLLKLPRVRCPVLVYCISKNLVAFPMPEMTFYTTVQRGAWHGCQVQGNYISLFPTI